MITIIHVILLLQLSIGLAPHAAGNDMNEILKLVKREIKHGFRSLKTEVQEAKCNTQSLISEITREINGMKLGLNGMKSGLNVLKSELNGVKLDIVKMKGDLTGIKTELVTIKSNLGNTDIVYKYTDAYQLIWKDANANIKGAVWRAQNDQSDQFCSLGDVATGSWEKPITKAILVKARESGALCHPTSFSKVWTDAGSGAPIDVALYKMNAPSGYTCLGGVAMRGYSYQPDSSKYCCVRNEYVVQADTRFTWNERGYGNAKKVSLWTVIRAEGDAVGVETGTFIAISGHDKPSSTAAYLLRPSLGDKEEEITKLKTVSLNIMQAMQCSKKCLKDDMGTLMGDINSMQAKLDMYNSNLIFYLSNGKILVAKKYYKMYRMKLLGFGRPTNYGKYETKTNVSLENCLKWCYEKRDANGPDWNGLQYFINKNRCDCNNNETGHGPANEPELHYRFS